MLKKPNIHHSQMQELPYPCFTWHRQWRDAREPCEQRTIAACNGKKTVNRRCRTDPPELQW